MTYIPDILHDNPTIIRTIRRITSVTYPETFDWSVGVNNVTRIAPYEEYGGGAVWFAVYDDDDIRWRVPAANMVVEYAALIEMPF